MRLTFIAIACGLVALVLPASSAPATDNNFPSFFAVADGWSLGGNVDVDFDFEALDSAADTQRISILVPSGYGVDLVHATGRVVGDGDLTFVPAGGGKQVLYSGHLVAMSAAAYAADAGAQVCDPGSHSADWRLQTKSSAGASIDVPIAIDESSGGASLTMCFGSAHNQNLELWGMNVRPSGSLATPTQPGKYLFDALVTPLAADGSPNTAALYELRAYEPLPQSLAVKATYSRSTKTLTVSGRLSVQRKPRSGAQLEVWTATSGTATGTKVGVATTKASGTYAFSRRLAVAPKYLWTVLEPTSYESCSGSSPDPGGCASYSIDGVESFSVKVTSTP